MGGTPITTFPLHLGLGATAVTEPEFTGDPAWYEAYGERHSTDGIEGRLVSMHSFDTSWDVWEMHPNGAEVVLCVAGTATLVQEIDGVEIATDLDAGHYVVNEPGVWHTADVSAGTSATMVFITSGLGTEHRMRQGAT